MYCTLSFESSKSSLSPVKMTQSAFTIDIFILSCKHNLNSPFSPISKFKYHYEGVTNYGKFILRNHDYNTELNLKWDKTTLFLIGLSDYDNEREIKTFLQFPVLKGCTV